MTVTDLGRRGRRLRAPAGIHSATDSFPARFAQAPGLHDRTREAAYHGYRRLCTAPPNPNVVGEPLDHLLEAAVATLGRFPTSWPQEVRREDERQPEEQVRAGLIPQVLGLLPVGAVAPGEVDVQGLALAWPCKPNEHGVYLT